MSVAHQPGLHAEVREAILDSVGRLLVRYGYRKMTVEDIAHEAGIGKGTVYLYFPSKEEVALGWFDRGHDRMSMELQAIAQSSLSPDRKLRELLVQRVSIGFERAQEFAESLDELFAAIRPSLLTRRERYQANDAAIIADVLREGCSNGSFEIHNIDGAAHAIVLAISSLLPYSLSVAQLGRREEVEARTGMIADLLLNGLRNHRICPQECNQH
jgi:AcrR family transcriptional regulator